MQAWCTSSGVLGWRYRHGSLNITRLEKCRNGDLLYTFTDAEDDMQLFWEAFPAAGGGRTTYMFTYADADAKRPTFEVPHPFELA